MAERAERTPEEREAARLERERRRGRAAGPSPPGPPGAEPPGPEPPPGAEPPLPPTAAGLTPAPDSHEPSDADDHYEVASGTRRVGWRERTAAVASRPRGSGQQKGTRHGRLQLSGRRSVIVRGLAVLALVLAAAVIWFCVELFQPFHGSGHGSVTVTIPAHSGTSRVADLLGRDGVIASAFFFELRVALAGDRGKLLAGTYQLKRDMSYGQVLKVLTTRPPAAKVTNVTITPGRTRAQVNALLRAQGVAGSYLAATRRSPLLHPAAYGAPARTDSLEGFLFPDTYQLREPISIPALVADQLRQFRREFATVGLGYARRKHLTAYDVLIIASMVEAEAQTAHDRPLIASAIYNRLADQMPLQIDATTRYATGNYTRPLTQSQLDSPSPYNTRIHRGLTPTPIDSPSLASIQAAAHPARTNYLYFVVKPCGNGEHVFASNYTQFLAEVQRYYSARRARGGKSPATC
jgi:peptidoglycan lytic transglycosylase G